jgi:hypothetical protein
MELMTDRLIFLKDKIEQDFKIYMNIKTYDINFKNNIYYIYILDNEGYQYYIVYDVLRNAKRRNLKLHKFFRNNIYTLDNIKNFLVQNNKEFQLISAECNSATEKLTWNCNIHENFITSWNCIKNGQGCPICSRISSSNIRKNNIDYIKTKFEEKNYILMTDEYINNEIPLPYICQKHKDKGIQYISFGNLIMNKRCKYCAKESSLLLQTKTQEQFEKEIYSIFIDKYKVIGKYINSKTHVEIYCNNCNESFFIAPKHLLNGHGCSNCSISRGEQKIKSFLISNNINFIQQYKFDDCKSKRKLPFDFAILNDDNLYCLIEYQGIQHYKSVEIFGGEKQFLEQQRVDKIKKDFCNNQNIKLIEIPYWDFNEINNILSKEFVE